jgi:hypothetical protein
VLLVRARLAYARHGGAGNPDPELDAAIAAVLDDPRSAPTPLHRLQVAVLRAEIACDRGDPAAAGRHLDEARGLAGGTGPGVAAVPAAVWAGIAGASGRLHALRGDPRSAAAAFDEQAGLARQARRFADMARALARAGEAHAAAGDPRLGADRLYRSAASYLAQGEGHRAADALAGAWAAIARAEDPLLSRLITGLRQEVDAAVAAANPVTPATSPARRLGGVE